MAAGPAYSFCSTSYQCADRLAPSLDSLERAAAAVPSAEFVVVDSWSTDGTWGRLQERAAADPRWTLLRERCSRGRGRELAFQRSRGQYVVRVDLDTVYGPGLARLLQRHAAWPERDRLALFAGYADVIPRRLLDEVGGWRDLNHFEDFDLRYRLLAHGEGALRHVDARLGENWETADPERRHARSRWSYLRRHITNLRSDFVARPFQGPLAKTREEWGRTRHRGRFLLLNPPLYLAAWLSTLGADKRRYDPAELQARWDAARLDPADWVGP